MLLTVLSVATIALWRSLDRVEGELAALHDAAAAGDRAVADLDRRVAGLESDESADFDPAAVAELVGPSVFMVVVPIDAETDSLGTGFVLGKDGRRSLVVTNYHVIEAWWDAGGRDVRLSQGNSDYVGEIVAVEPSDDLALIEVAADLPALEPADEAPQPGDQVVVVGAGAGLEGTVTTGVVSAVDRVAEGREWLQFSAQVNPGNSGGPVVDAQGQVIGVATQKLVALELEGLSFAIPIDRVCQILDIC
jgi:putative serine protease PepD